MKGVTGYRPPGGGIEFGETGASTVVRVYEARFADPSLYPEGLLELIGG